MNKEKETKIIKSIAANMYFFIPKEKNHRIDFNLFYYPKIAEHLKPDPEEVLAANINSLIDNFFVWNILAK